MFNQVAQPDAQKEESVHLMAMSVLEALNTIEPDQAQIQEIRKQQKASEPNQEQLSEVEELAQKFAERKGVKIEDVKALLVALAQFKWENLDQSHNFLKLLQLAVISINSFLMSQNELCKLSYGLTIKDVGIGKQLVSSLVESCAKVLQMNVASGIEFQEPLKTVRDIVKMLQAFHVYTTTASDFSAIQNLHKSIDFKKLNLVNESLSKSKKAQENQITININSNEQKDQTVTLPKVTITEDEPLENILNVQTTDFLAVKSHLEQAQLKINEKAQQPTPVQSQGTVDEVEIAQRKSQMFVDFKELIIKDLKEPLDQFAAKIQTVILGFKDPLDMDALVLKLTSVLAKEVQASQAMQLIDVLCEKQLTEKAESLLESLVSRVQGENQMQTDAEEDDSKKLEILGAILKLQFEMQTSSQEKVFKKCGDLSWLSYFNYNLIETYIKRINKQISSPQLTEEERNMIFLQVTNIINLLTNAGEEDFQIAEESLNASEAPASEIEEKKEDKKDDSKRKPPTKPIRKGSGGLKQAKLDKKQKILSLSMRIKEGKEKVKSDQSTNKDVIMIAPNAPIAQLAGQPSKKQPEISFQRRELVKQAISVLVVLLQEQKFSSISMLQNLFFICNQVPEFLQAALAGSLNNLLTNQQYELSKEVKEELLKALETEELLTSVTQNIHLAHFCAKFFIKFHSEISIDSMSNISKTLIKLLNQNNQNYHVTLGLFVTILNYLQGKKKQIVEHISDQLVSGEEKIETFLHLFKILNLVLLKSGFKKAIIEFFTIKRADQGAIGYKSNVFKYMREYTEELETADLESIKEKLSFDNLLKQLRKFGNNPNGSFSGPTITAIKELIQLYCSLFKKFEPLLDQQHHIEQQSLLEIQSSLALARLEFQVEEVKKRILTNLDSNKFEDQDLADFEEFTTQLATIQMSFMQEHEQILRSHIKEDKSSESLIEAYREYLMHPQITSQLLKQDENFNEFSQAEINALDLAAIQRSITMSNGSFSECLIAHCISTSFEKIQKILSYATLLKVIYRAKIQIIKQLSLKKKDMKEKLQDDLSAFQSIFVGSSLLQTYQRSMDMSQWDAISLLVDNFPKHSEISTILGLYHTQKVLNTFMKIPILKQQKKMLTDIISLSAKLLDTANKLEPKIIYSFFDGTLEYCSNMPYQDISYIQSLFQMLALPAKCPDETEDELKKENLGSEQKKGGVSFVIDIGQGNQSESDASIQEKKKKQEQQQQILLSHFAEFGLESIISVFPSKPDQVLKENAKYLRQQILQTFSAVSHLHQELFKVQLNVSSKAKFQKLLQHLCFAIQDEEKELIGKVEEIVLSALMESVKTAQDGDQAISAFKTILEICQSAKKLALCLVKLLPTIKERTIRLRITDLLLQVSQPQLQDDKGSYSLSKVKENRLKAQEKRQKEQAQKEVDSKEENQSQVDIAGFRQKVHKANKPDDFKKAMLKPSDKCSYLVTNRNYHDQHWYYCYTCGLSNNQGCCSVCVFTCHAGHDVAYSRKSNFFCDCGDVGQCVARMRDDGDDSAPPPPGSFGFGSVFGGGAPGAPGGDRAKKSAYGGFGQPQPADLGLGLFAGNRNAPPGGARESRGFDPGMFLQRGFEDAGRGRGGARGRPSGPGRGGRRGEPGGAGLFGAREEGREGGLSSSIFGYRDEFQRIVEAERLARSGRDFGGEEDLQEMILREQELMEEEQQFIDSQQNRREPWRELEDHVDEESEYKKILEQAKNSMQKIDAPLNPLADNKDQKDEEMKDESKEEPPRKASRRESFGQKTTASEFENKNLQVPKSDLVPEFTQQTDILDLIVKDFIEIFEQEMEKEAQKEGQMQVEDQNLNLARGSSALTQLPKEVTEIKLTKNQSFYEAGTFAPTYGDKNALRVTQQYPAFRNMISCHENNFIVVLEGSEDVNIYSTQRLKSQENRIEQLNKLSTFKPAFTPIKVSINPENPNYIAIIGLKQVQILVLSKTQQIAQSLTVDLMLEAFGPDLTLVNVKWLPGFQTRIAIATPQFIKLYDLAKDQISPSHNLEIIEDQCRDFAFLNQGVKESNGMVDLRILVGTQSGKVFTQEIEMPSEQQQQSQNQAMEQDNSHIVLIEPLVWEKVQGIEQPPTSPVIALYYAERSKLLFVTYMGGQTYIGKLSQDLCKLESYFLLDLQNQAKDQLTKQQLEKNGSLLVNFTETGEPVKNRETNVYEYSFVAIAKIHGQNSGMPVALKITESQVQIQVLCQQNLDAKKLPYAPTLGLTYGLRPSSQSNGQEELIYFLNDNGFLQSMVLRGKETKKLSFTMSKTLQSSSSSSSQKTMLMVDLKMQDLPSEATLPNTWFEVWSEINPDFVQKNRVKASVSGDITKYISNKNQFDSLIKQVNINEKSKKSITMVLKLDSPEILLAGFRIYMDIRKKNQKETTTIKVMNRSVNVQRNMLAWVDVPLCDVEILKAAKSGLEVDIQTSNAQQNPILISQFQFFGVQKKDFNFVEKVQALEEMIQSEEDKKNKNKEAESIDEIYKELSQTKGESYVHWIEKQQIISRESKKSDLLEQIQSIDSLSQVFPCIETMEKQKLVLSQSLPKFKQILKKIALEEEQNKGTTTKILKATVKRALRKMLQICYPSAGLGHEMNFYSILDSITLEIAQGEITQLTENQMQSLLKKFNSIFEKRTLNAVVIFEKNPNLLEKIFEAFNLLDTNSTALYEGLPAIIAIDYIARLNQLLAKKTFVNIKDAFEYVKQNEKIFKPSFSKFEQLLSIKNQDLQHATFMKIYEIQERLLTLQIEQLEKKQAQEIHFGSQTSFSSQELKNDLGETVYLVNMVYLDFTPLVLSYFLDSFQSQKQTQEVVMTLVYKFLKIYDEKEISNEEIKELIFTQISQPAAKLIKSLPQVISSPESIGTNLSQPDQKQQILYLLLVHTNVLLFKTNDQDSAFKQSEILLQNEKLHRAIQAQFTQEEAQELGKWVQEAVISVFREFDQDNGSVKKKIEDGVIIGTYESSQSKASQLLKVQTLANDYHLKLIFADTEGIYQKLDRKLACQLAIFARGLAEMFKQKEVGLSGLTQAIVKLSFTQPLQEFMEQIGLSSLQALTDKNQAMHLKQKHQYSEVTQSLEKLNHNFFSKGIQPGFNTMFTLFESIEQAWHTASRTPEIWQEFISEQANPEQIFSTLISSSYNLNEKTAQLCLNLAAAGLNKGKENIQALVSSSSGAQPLSASLGQQSPADILALKSLYEGGAGMPGGPNQEAIREKIELHRKEKKAAKRAAKKEELVEPPALSFSLKPPGGWNITSKDPVEKKEEIKETDQKDTEMKEEIKLPDITLNESVVQNIDYAKLIDVLLIAKNDSKIRAGAEAIVKGIWNTASKELKEKLKRKLISKLSSIKSYGQNSSRYLNTISFIFKSEENISDQEKEQIARALKQSLQESNQTLMGHQNLEIYAALSKICSIDQPNETGLGPSQKKMSNAYILETDPCSKCFEAAQEPWNSLRLNDVKTEMKFTDSCLLYKLSKTLTVRSISVNMNEFKGAKCVKSLNFYVNNKQNMDLAEMRNNWAIWRRVKQIEVEICQRNLLINFPLPIEVDNILIEINTVTLAKPISKGELYQASQNQDQASKTLDFITCLLKDQKVLKKFQSSSNQQFQEADQGAFLEQMVACPRCSKKVSNKHGNCSGCGDNIFQCAYCRNINYEKLDAFICNECGQSRHVKLDFTFTCRKGFASERIETEDQKQTVLKQIDETLSHAQTNYQNLMKKRLNVAQLISQSPKVDGIQIAEFYRSTCQEQYNSMMKHLTNVKVQKQTVHQFTIQGQQSADDEDPELEMPVFSLKKSISQHEDVELPAESPCFSCTQEFIKSVLNFIRQTSQQFSQIYCKEGLQDLLYEKNLNTHNSSINDNAKNALCVLALDSKDLLQSLLLRIEKNLFSKQDIIPPHQLSSNLKEESSLLIMIIKKLVLKPQESDKEYEVAQEKNEILMNSLMTIFKKSLEFSANMPITDQVAKQCLQTVAQLLFAKPQAQKYTEEQRESVMKFQGSTGMTQTFQTLIKYAEQYKDQKEENKKRTLELQNYESMLEKVFKVIDSDDQNENWLIQCLLTESSLRTREIARDILIYITVLHEKKRTRIIQILLLQVQEALKRGDACDCYFELLNFLFNPEKMAESNESEKKVYEHAFKSLFEQVDKELKKMVLLEKEKELLGTDGFLPAINAGQSLSKLMQIISFMIQKAPYIKSLVKKQVRLVIRSYIKLRKLNLVKNKLVLNVEQVIEKIFNEMNSEKQEDKEEFIIEFTSLLQEGESDEQEQRFLCEEITKILVPIKPDPIYLLNLNKAQSQEMYIRGRMEKNPYQSTQVGKTMGEVRVKICKEVDLQEPELIELLVGKNLVEMHLPVKLVYEQVWWPQVCKQRDPDCYEIPNIDEQPLESLPPMQVTYRLAGIDGEATEDRVENLTDESQSEAAIAKKLQVAEILTKELPKQVSSSIMDTDSITGVQVLMNSLQEIRNLKSQRYFAEQLFKLLNLITRIKSVRQTILKKDSQAISKLTFHLFSSLDLDKKGSGGPHFDYVLETMEALVGEVAELEKEVRDDKSNQEKMEIEEDSQEQQGRVEKQVNKFMQIMSEACEEMIQAYQKLDQTSHRIQATAKILPFLLKPQNEKAIQVIADMIDANLVLENVDRENSDGFTNQDRFRTEFWLHRIIEIIQSTPVNSAFLKDAVIQKGLLTKVIEVISKHDLQNEQEVSKKVKTLSYAFKFLMAQLMNHPASQKIVAQANLIQPIQSLSTAKFNDKNVCLIASEIIKNLSSPSQLNDKEVHSALKSKIDKEEEDKKKAAMAKKKAMMAKRMKNTASNKFAKMAQEIQADEDKGPKCIVCHEGYSKKPAEILGVYTYNKKCIFSELVGANYENIRKQNGFITVTQFNAIHLVCHQESCRADANMRPAKREWEGAQIRNQHTKCNNLFPIRGGQINMSAYGQTVDRYLKTIKQQVVNYEGDAFKTLLWDIKDILRKLVYQESFSRDTHGGGPEDNLKLLPHLVLMAIYLLQNKGNQLKEDGSYDIETKIVTYLETSGKKKNLEEEKSAMEYEEEEKKEDVKGTKTQSEQVQIDNFLYYLVAAFITKPWKEWEKVKIGFFNALGRVAGNIQSLPAEDMNFGFSLEALPEGGLTDREKNFLLHAQPLLQALSLCQFFKQHFDVETLKLDQDSGASISGAQYVHKLQEILATGNLEQSMTLCSKAFEEFKSKLSTKEKVEEFLEYLKIGEEFRNQSQDTYSWLKTMM